MDDIESQFRISILKSDPKTHFPRHADKAGPTFLRRTHQIANAELPLPGTEISALWVLKPPLWAG